MKRNRFSKVVFLSLLFIFASLGFARQASLPDQITIGFIPGDDLTWLKKNGVALAKDLESKLQVPVNIYISKNYHGLVTAMKDKKVDFAFFSAVTFVEAEKTAGAKVLMKKVWDGPFYYSSIVTLKSSDIHSINDLRSKRIGFVDEKSASGHLYPLAMLKKKFGNVDHFFKSEAYFGQHEANIKALIDKKVDAVAVYADDSKALHGVWEKVGLQTKDIRVLWVSDPIPNDPFCVRQDFYDRYSHFTHDLMFVFIGYKDQPDDKNLLKKLYGIKEMDLATSRQYDPVRQLVKFLHLND